MLLSSHFHFEKRAECVTLLLRFHNEARLLRALSLSRSGGLKIICDSCIICPFRPKPGHRREFRENIDLKLEILKGRRGLEAAKVSWRALTESKTVTSISQLVDYYLSYAPAFEVSDEELLIATVKDSADRAIAILPLRRSSKSFLGVKIRVLEFPDVPVPVRDIAIDSSYPSHDILEFILQAIGKELGDRWDYMQLRDLPEGSALLTLQEKEGHWLRLIRQVGVSHSIDLSKPDYIDNALNSNARNNLRRSRKKIDKLGKVDFRTVTEFPELKTAYDQFLTTEAAGWKSVRGGKRAIKLHADQTQFYFELMVRLANTGQCHIHLLYVDDRPVASDYCIVSGEKCFSVKHGYDEDYSRFAPGNLLRAYTIEYYQQSGSVKCLDLLSGWDWQRRWRPKKNGIFDIKIFSQSLRGTMLYHLARLRHR
jgi:CelD/BcsL family acetyltransferase involved in cellulose biosynthesis